MEIKQGNRSEDGGVNKKLVGSVAGAVGVVALGALLIFEREPIGKWWREYHAEAERIAAEQRAQAAREAELERISNVNDLRVLVESASKVVNPTTARGLLAKVSRSHFEALETTLESKSIEERGIALTVLIDLGDLMVRHRVSANVIAGHAENHNPSVTPVDFFSKCFNEYVADEPDMALRHKAADRLHELRAGAQAQ